MSIQTVAMFNLFGKSAIVLGAALLASLAAAPRLRVLLFRCAFAVALAAPVATSIGFPKVGIFTSTASSTAVSPIAGSMSLPALPQERGYRSRNVSPMAVQREKRAIGSASVANWPGATFEWAPALIALWLAGILFVAARLAYSYYVLSRAFRAGHHAPLSWKRRMLTLQRELGVEFPIGLRLSHQIAAPCAFGVRRPRILLPAHEFSDDTLDAVLAHELCHVRHRDTLWLIVGRLACALHWFNPLVWACLRRYRDEIELVCDDSALRGTKSAQHYANALVETARHMIGVRTTAGVMMSSRGMAARIRHVIEQENGMPPLTLRSRTAVLASAVLALILVATTDLVAAQTEGRAGSGTMITLSPARQMPPIFVAIPLGSVASAGAGMFPLDERYDVQNMVARVMKAGDGALYLNVAGRITVSARQIGFMCSGDARCVATVAPNSDVTLTVSKDSPATTWKGCTPSADGRSCTVRVTRGSVHVDVNAARS
jgi:beta-lactamase regulating signal transducer with metallopeptidase domain